MESGSREEQRLRWRSRRGLLEMDLILERFLALHLASLSHDELVAYDQMLDLPDNDFLDLAMGKTEPANEQFVAVLAKIRNS
jgi:succinate dehydrogenase / fumarate reductase iron-sulfur subunit/antitoxin CptB